MARGKKRRGHRKSRSDLTPQRRKFKAAVKTCWSEMASGKLHVSPKSLGKCMRKHL